MADLFEGAPPSWIKNHILSPEVLQWVHSKASETGRNQSPEYQNTVKSIEAMQASRQPLRTIPHVEADQMGASIVNPMMASRTPNRLTSWESKMADAHPASSTIQSMIDTAGDVSNKVADLRQGVASSLADVVSP